MKMYTIGYGVTTVAEFLERLKELPVGTIIVDVRKLGSHSRSELESLLYFIRDNRRPICLLCAERKPFRPNGKPNCHRVIIAEELAKWLNCEVVHL